MSLLTDFLLCVGVLAAWFGTFVFLRLETPLERLHAVTFVNIMTVGAIVIASFCAHGEISQLLKCGFILITNLLVGALLSHVMGRAIHFRSGTRR